MKERNKRKKWNGANKGFNTLKSNLRKSANVTKSKKSQITNKK